MKLRTVAAIPLVVMSLFNLPIGVSPDGIPAVLAWSITLLGVLGLAAAVALIRRRRGAEVVALAVGAVNVVAGAHRAGRRPRERRAGTGHQRRDRGLDAATGARPVPPRRAAQPTVTTPHDVATLDRSTTMHTQTRTALSAVGA
jgi:MYXO-CTERM domain-containing protein